MFNEIGIWIAKQIMNTSPKSQLGKAMNYAADR